MDGHLCLIYNWAYCNKSLRDRTRLPFDVHLMMNNPMDYIDDFVDAEPI